MNVWSRLMLSVRYFRLWSAAFSLLTVAAYHGGFIRTINKEKTTNTSKSHSCSICFYTICVLSVHIVSGSEVSYDELWLVLHAISYVSKGEADHI